MDYKKIGLEISFLRGVFSKIGTIIRGKSNILHICSIGAFFKNPSKPLIIRVTAICVNLYYTINIVMFIIIIVFL